MTVSYSSLPYFVQGLIDSETYNVAGNRWSGVGQGVTLAFNFAASPIYGEQGFRLYSEAQKTSVRLALDHWVSVSGLDVVEVASNAAAQLTFFQDDLTSQGAESGTGYAWMPSWYFAEGGDVHVSSDYFLAGDSFAPGSFAFQTLLHEIGHALGLKHPFESPALPVPEDTQTNTVMTYNLDFANAEALGMFDLAAVHTLYGVDSQARAGNNRYTFSDRYIWDGGGIDTLDGSAEVNWLTINLAPGSWVHSGGKASSILAPGQVFIGYGTFIENAIGGSGNDRLTGNARANVLTGNGGHDVLYGGKGNDVLRGGAGDDTLFGQAGSDTLAGGAGSDVYYIDALDSVTELGGGGLDRVYGAFSLDLNLYANVEQAFLRGSDHWSLTGSASQNYLVGNAGNNLIRGLGGSDALEGGAGSDTLDGGSGMDALYGQAGNDSLVGGAGDDLLDGGMGRDTLAGGRGRDTFVFRSVAEIGQGSKRDVIMDFESGVDIIDLSAIDADLSTLMQDRFGFLGGGSFTGVAGQLRYVQATGILAGDINGDRVADFQIQLMGNPALTQFDLIA